jgi:hypothetical protein
MVTTPQPRAALPLADLRGISPRTWRLIALVVGAMVAVALVITALRTGPLAGSPDLTIDPEFGIPTPPHATPYHSTANVVATMVMTVVGLVGVALGVRDRRRTGSWLPLVLALSGAMITFPEVFVDVMGAVYFPWSDANHAYTIIGREMPWWIVAGWFGYGVNMYFIFRVLQSNPPTKVLWWLLGGAAASSVVFEELLLSTGIYHYYGNQPLVLVARLPWWWIPCNSIGVFLAAALAYRYRHRLTGWRSLAMLLITPMSVAGVYGFIAMPGWIAVNGDYGWLPTQLLGLSVFVLGTAVFMFLLEAVLGRPPLRPEFVPAVEDAASFGSTVQGRQPDPSPVSPAIQPSR